MTQEGITKIQKSDGKIYSVRNRRDKYFFPEEWEKFFEQIKGDRNKLFFLTALHTGGRVMEILNLRPKDFDYDRQTVTFETTKQRKAKKNFYASGKTRTFFVSPKLLKKIKKYVKKNKIEQNQYLFLDNSKLPEDYYKLDNKEKKKYYQTKKVCFSSMMKRALKRSGIDDYYMYSLHNIRKTYGNWMRIFDISTEEICFRLGHDMKTFMTHYGTSLVLGFEDKRKIMRILGDVK